MSGHLLKKLYDSLIRSSDNNGRSPLVLQSSPVFCHFLPFRYKYLPHDSITLLQNILSRQSASSSTTIQISLSSNPKTFNSVCKLLHCFSLPPPPKKTYPYLMPRFRMYGSIPPLPRCLSDDHREDCIFTSLLNRVQPMNRCMAVILIVVATNRAVSGAHVWATRDIENTLANTAVKCLKKLSNVFMNSFSSCPINTVRCERKKKSPLQVS